MNYSSSKNNIVPVINDTPAQLTDFINQLSSKTLYDTNFLMMPVRLETRFRKVYENLLDDVTKVSVKGAVTAISSTNTLVNSYGVFANFNSSSALQAAQDIQLSLSNVSANFAQIASITPIEQNQLQYNLQLVNNNINNTTQALLAACTDGNLIPQLNQTISIINASLQNLTSITNSLPADTSWEEQISGEVINNWQPAVGIINNNDQLLPQVFQDGTIQQGPFQQIINNSNQLGEFFNRIPVTASNDKQYVWTQINAVSTQFSTLYDYLSRAQGDPQTLAQLKQSLTDTKTLLNQPWQQMLFPGLSQDKLTLDPAIQDIKPTANDVSSQIGDMGNGIGNLVNSTTQLTLKITNYVQNNPQDQELISLFNLYISQVQAIAGILVTPLSDPISTAFIWGKIAPLNGQFATLQPAIGAISDPTNQSVVQQNFNTTTNTVTTAWNTSAGIDTSKATLFDPYVLVDELWIRVYPDDFEVDSLERGITLDESNAGITYWTSWWAAHGNKTLQLQAWQILVSLYGPERAAWIVKQMMPTNLSNVVIISPFFPFSTSLGLLDTFTTSVSALSVPALTASAATHLSYYGPQLSYLSSAAQKVPGIPVSYAAQASIAVNAAITNFNQLGNVIITNTGGEGEGGQGSQFSQTVSSIQTQFSSLSQAIERIPTYATWDEIYSETPVFPSPTLVDSSWSQPSVSNVMPDSFLFAAVNNVSDGSYSFRHIKIGNPIPQPLYTSIDPQGTAFTDTATGNLNTDPNILWMVDFGEAVQKGMGIKIRLTADEAKNGFDKLLVLGTKLQGGTQSSLPALNQQLLQYLLDGHHYTPGGLSLLELGTPTNNTDTTNAGYNQTDPFAEASFATEVSDPLFSGTSNTITKKDGQWLADALGIDYSILQHVENADKSQISNAISMNRVLWSGTVGNYMKEMMNFLFTEDNAAKTKDYFTDYVIGRGALPSIRVAEQPYGILPVTSFGRWEWERVYPDNQFPGSLSTTDGSNDITSYFLDDYVGPFGANLPLFLQDRFNIRLTATLEILNNAWLQMATWKVKTVDKNKGIANTQADFMDLLSVDASMSEVYNRYFLNSMKFDNSHSFSTEGNTPADIWSSGILDIPTSFFNLFTNFNSGIYSPGPPAGAIPNPLGDANGLFDINEFFSLTNGIPNMTRIKNALRIFSVQFLESYRLFGPTVAEGSSVSETTPLPNDYLGKNYINWLLTTNPSQIWTSNQFRQMPSRSLLFLLLRQAVMLTYRETAGDILEAANVFTKVSRKIIGTPEGIFTQQMKVPNSAIFTKWHLLFENITNITSSNYLGASTPVGPAFNFFYNYVGDITTTARPPFVSPTWSGIKLADYLFAPSPSLGAGYSDLNTIGSPFLSGITNMKAALTQLQTCSTAELDRLMREHMDLCTYRLDAWNYGMVNKKLWTLSNTDGTHSSGVRKQGIYLSCYGWLIDVRPKLVPGTTTSALEAVNTTHIPAGLTDFTPVYYDNTNLGFIQTPSMAHALAAAVLRSGYISEKNTDDNRFAVNLASTRVDLALSLLEGIRNGQTLDALLGYQFENMLHEGYPALELDKFIYPLRQKFPIVDGASDPTTVIAPTENLRPSNVIAGVELLNAIRTNVYVAQYLNEFPTASLYEIFADTAGGPYNISGIALSSYAPFSLFNGITVPSYTTAEFNAIMTEIDRIANAIDALGDLSIAEGIFQIAKGNFSRSAAVMESLTEGKNPSMPEVVDTPRSGVHINHRLAAMVAPVSATSPWSSVTTVTPRAVSEPNLNNWVAQLLVAPFSSSTSVTVSNFPDKIGCKVTFNDINNVSQSVTVSLSNLKIQPIDLLYLVQSDSYKAEFINRITFYVKSATTLYNPPVAGIPLSVSLNIDLNNKGTGTVASFQQVFTLIASIAQTVNASRWLKSDDFIFTPNAVTDATKPLYDVPELKNRAQALVNAVNTHIGVLSGLPTITIADSVSNNPVISNIRTQLLIAANFGLAYAIPTSAGDMFTSTPSTTVEGYVAAMQALVLKAKTDLTNNYNAANTILGTIAGITDQDKQVNACVSVITTILGTGFKAIPYFFFDYYTGIKSGSGGVDALLTTPINTSTGIMRNHATDFTFDMDNWLYGLARVQNKVADIETIRLLADDDNSYPLKDIRPVQFPYIPASSSPVVEEDYWYGLSYPSTYTPSSDKLSVAIFNYGQLSSVITSTSPGYTSYNIYCGLMLEEWNELIPFNEETTGIAFNHDQPRAKPPQNLLLAVNPQVMQTTDTGVKTWRMEDLLYTMLDTMDMAKIRMVEPDHFVRAQSTDIKNNENANALDNGIGIMQTATTTDSNNTAYFEAFKWLLPAVVGEVTPAELDGNGNIKLSGNKIVYQSSDSIQQVSFDYNPNDAAPPVLPGTISSSTILDQVANWTAVSSDAVLSDNSVNSFVTEQSTFADIAIALDAMTASIGG